ncbi:MAG: hypothetical protein GTN84_19015 [Hydrogenophaga sp.]|uniref:hypothetical protein n=1 Tax=Hydrogenophaga sp. TaxID=1904254 RepID=UPI0016AD32EF|nr:hypothetical protein [Hydrogenophaga sp.]NIM43337.1 hypothetical protein [Hydrogenophaga sp.]NIN28406.1 hypothetical protein [Hydrogenophaga sp.]NIN29225.1 hypothetical protein [Hydrogenophaga sp.]NIN57540.1 hypothetical protein [Hydrogenophaga sp.]NIO53835.1 hypothetical protein [Hydrogenophaga sp.]
MPVVERALALDLAQRLQERTQAGDVAALGALDREVGALLIGLANKRPLDAGTRSACALLRQAHQRALALVRREHDAVQAKLHDLCAHRGGRDAYAVAAE